jgi:exodeoxyribonuclease-5
MKLTSEQKHVIKEILKFHKDVTIVGGRAGTGKSTIIRHLIELLPNFAVCAYTGKAANVLRRRGIDAKTIHSLIYKAREEDKKVIFSLAYDIDCEGIIVDESSMVSKEIYEDLKYFKKPIIFVGDHGQLEPIGEKFNLMQNPDFKLETIHRNAGEIAFFADHIRKGYKPSSWEHKVGSGGKVCFLNKSNYKNYVLEVDQIICAYNKTRAELNKFVREQMDKGKDPEIGDRVMCLRNNSYHKLFNGMQGVVTDIYDHILCFQTDDNYFEISYEKNTFNQIKYEFEFNIESPNPFDYCYAITCHRAQGDQFDRILVLEQKCDLWDHKRWAYTAASRAVNKIYWCN